MRLARIEATRFGRLHDASLGPLGEGLTLVLGPNEAGKSSFTALVRYLLYGFPTEKSVSDPPYLSDAGTREGRLVFESAEGEWVIERSAGPKGGPSSARAVRGPERPGLIDELTGGVSEQAFKVVFGFGLAEMAEIERLRGTGDDIIGKLYAAGAGLTVSPQEVRAAIESEADALYRPRGSRPLINALLAKGRDVRTAIASLERDAEQLAADRDRLGELAAELESARVERDDAAAHHRMLLEEARTLSGFEEVVRDTEEELLGLRRRAREAAEVVSGTTVDERVLDASAEIGALADELSAFKKGIETARDLETQAGARATEVAMHLAEAGLDEASATAVDVTPETREGVERWREILRTAGQRAETAAEERDRAADAALVVSRQSSASGQAPAPRPAASDIVPWAVVVLAGIASAIAGTVSAQWVLTGIGIVLAAFAAAMLLRLRTGPGRAVPDTLLQAERVTEAERRAQETALAAERLERSLAEARREWDTFRVERGLFAVTDPVAAARVLDLVAQARRVDASRDEAEARLGVEERAIAAYVERVAAVATALGVPAPAGPYETPATVARLKERLDEERRAATDKERAIAEAAAADAAVADTEERRDHAAAQARGIIERLDVSGGLAELSAAVERAERRAAETQERWGELGGEYASLEARVGERERTDTMGKLRFELESVNERIAEHAERYAVLSVATRLLERAQDRYERERQPEVVREAERIFTTITGGGYPRLSVPLGSSPIEVFDAAARAKDTARLSTGTAEQLYLALRLALIGQLGAKGAALPVLMDDVFANFDPERKAGAARAVADLANGRQVVVFTCHPETVAAFEEAATEYTALTLDRC